MDIVRQLLLVVHLVAFAALLGGLLGQAKVANKAVHTSTIWGARIAFLAGLLLVGVIEMGSDDVADGFHAKVGVKLLVGLAVVGLLEARRKKGLTDVLYWVVVGLTVANVAVAVLWNSAHHF
jgi:FtsH-binding integral membrane protein